MPNKPRNNEDEYFARIDFERRRRLVQEQRKAMSAYERERLKQEHFMHCPRCGMSLEEITYRGIQIDRCFNCGGVWLDESEFDEIAGKEPSFIEELISLFKGVSGPE